MNDIKFLTVEDIMELTGYSRPIVLQLFKRPDFPTWNYGKRLLVEKNAFLKFAETGCRKELE